MNAKKILNSIGAVLAGKLFTSIAVALLCQSSVMALPNLQNVPRPNPEPAFPAGFDLFSPPVDASTPSANAAAIAEWTRTGGPDDTLVLTGNKLSGFTGADAGKDTRFLVFGQTTSGNATQKDAWIQRLDGVKAAITLDPGLPNWSMYLMWPRNNAGYGYPRAVNQTEAWWLGPKQATRGETIAVFGRNLSNQNGTNTAWIYIKPVSGAGQWAAVTAVNPYRVAFTVPTSLANGSYEVWAHNGHGRTYGWAGPLTLTVDSGTTWTSTEFNVRNYGALGNGVNDDEAAIQSARNAAAASPGSTIYFPAGTYMVSRGFSPPSNVRWRGDGRNSTFIKLNSSFIVPPDDGRRYALFFNDQGPVNLEIKDMTLDANGNLKGYLGTLVRIRGASNIRLTGLTIRSLGYDILDLNNSSRLYISNCDLVGKSSFLGAGTQAFIDGCNYYGSDDTGTMWYSWGRSQLSMTRSTGRDYNNAISTGWAQGRFFTGNGGFGSSRDLYFGDNTTFDLTVRPDLGEQNTGEQMMWEGHQTVFRGTPSSATATTVTFSTLTDNHTGQEAIIMSGKGLGQHRTITAFDSANKRITVSPPWNVTPDGTSSVIIQRMTARVAVFRNSLDAKDRAATSVNHIASSGIQPYGGCFDFVVDNNTVNQTRAGIAVWGLDQSNPADVQPSHFHLYVNNRLQNNRWGIQNIVALFIGLTFDPGATHLGMVHRRNTITSPVLAGVTASCSSIPGLVMDLTVYDRNTGSNVPVGFDLAGSANENANSILIKNNFNRGAAALAGSKAINFGAGGQTVGLRLDTWSNYETTYSGTLPGAILEAPYRVLEASSSGASVNTSLTLQNSGTASLGWTASDDASWLSLSAASGTVAAENSANLTVTCSPSGLASGTYTGTITLTAGTQTKKVTVLFTVTGISTTPPAPSNLSATAVSSSQINLAWTDNAGNETGFKIERKTGAGGTWAQIATTGANAISYNDSGLAASTTYYYRVRAYNGGGDSAYSNEANATTQAAGGSTVSVNDNTVGSSNNQFEYVTAANWPYSAEPGAYLDDNHYSETANAYYQVRFNGTQVKIYTKTKNNHGIMAVSINGGAETMVDCYSSTIVQQALVYTSPVLASGQHTLKVRVTGTRNASSSGNWIIADRVDVISGVSSPAAPSGLTATAISSSQINLSWTDNSGNEDGFKIERKTGAGGVYGQIGTVGANVTSYNDSALSASTTYYYRIRAYNSAGDSAYSNEANATTQAPAGGGLGTISREVWTGIAGNAVASIPLGNLPNIIDSLASFEAPTDWSDNYGTRVRGYIIPPTTGNYTFWIASDDDSELWLSTDYQPATKVKIASVTGWTSSREWNKYSSQKSTARSLTAGTRYYVEALQKEGAGGDNLAVGWARPGQATTAPSEVIPGSSLAPFSGLKGDYYNGTDFSTFRMSRVDPQVNFDWAGGSPDPLVNADGFSVRWTGLVRPRFSETYTFYTTSDDGVRLWVNGQQLINKWVVQGATEWSGTIALTANQDYDIRLEYFEATGGASARLSWSSPGEAKAIIPSNRLYPPTGLPGTWASSDIGSVGYLGTATYEKGQFTVKASGVDIWDSSDAFHFVYLSSSGDCELKARVTAVQNTDPWAKAGVMIRESLNANSKHAFMILTPGNGTSFQYRNSTGGTSAMSHPYDGITAPYWLRIVRVGSTFTGYKSADGINWVQVGSTSITFNSAAYIGLGVTAHNNATRNTSTLDNITAIP